MNSSLFKLHFNDFSKGLVTAILVAVVATLWGVIGQTGFNVFTADWGTILASAINTAIIAFIGYLAKNFISDEQGKVLGRIG